jgi:hypothetical protein
MGVGWTAIRTGARGAAARGAAPAAAAVTKAARGAVWQHQQRQGGPNRLWSIPPGTVAAVSIKGASLLYHPLYHLSPTSESAGGRFQAMWPLPRAVATHCRSSTNPNMSAYPYPGSVSFVCAGAKGHPPPLPDRCPALYLCRGGHGSYAQGAGSPSCTAERQPGQKPSDESCQHKTKPPAALVCKRHV